MDPAYRIVPDGQMRPVVEDGREVQEVEVATPAAVDGNLQYYVVYSQDGAPVSYALAPQVGATSGAVYCPPGATPNAANVGYQFVVGDPATLNGTPVEYSVGGTTKRGPVALEYSIDGSQVPNNAVLTYGVTDPAAVGSVSYESGGYPTPGSPESETLSFAYGRGQKCIVTKTTEPPAEFVLPKGGGQPTRYYLLEPESVSDDGILNLEQYCAFPVVDRLKVQKLYEFEIIARRPALEEDPVLHVLRLRLYAPTSMGAKQRFWFLLRHWRRFHTMDLEIESVTQKNGSLVVRWATTDLKQQPSQSTTDIPQSASTVQF